MRLRFPKVLSASAAVAFLVSCSSLQAAPETAAAASHSRARVLDPASISARALTNGVRSVCQEAPGTDLVSVQIWVKAGSRYETDENNGATHLIETLAVETSPSAPERGLRAAIENLGGEVGALTARDSMFLSATVASPFLPEAIKVLSEAALQPDLSDARVNAAKAGILSEMVAATSDPVRGASDLAYGAAFSKHPYRMAAHGTPLSLRALTGAKVRAYHAGRFAGSNISVVVVGDVARDTAHRLVEQYFGKAGRVASGVPTVADAPLTQVVKVSRQGVLQVSTMALSWRSAPVSDAIDAVALDVLLAHWKEGRDPVLGRELGTQPLRNNRDEEAIGEGGAGESTPDGERAPEAQPPAPTEEKLPLALAFDVDYLTQRDSGLFLVTLLAPRDRNAAVAAVLEAVGRIRDDGISDAQLSRAKFLLTQQYIDQAESVSGIAGALGFYEMIDSHEFAVKYLDRVANITNDDLKRVVTKYLNSTAYVQATIEGRPERNQQGDGGTITARLFKD